MATIDVLLPVKNGLPFLAEAIDSVRRQSFRDWRLLVLDHGSTDGSAELTEQYGQADRRVQLHRFPAADSLAGLLNHGLDLCDCRFMMRLDADDACLPRRMDMSLQAFASHRGTLVVGGQADVVNASGQRIARMRLPIGAERVTASSFFRNPMSHPALMMDFAATTGLGARYGIDFLRALPAQYSMTVNNLAEDYFMFGQLAMLGACRNIAQPLIRYRWHDNNVSVMRFEEQMAQSLKISRFLARSFCAMHGMPAFDPAPFCNHGGKVYDMGDERSLAREFNTMSACLRRTLGASDEVERELRFRHVLATRRVPHMLLRYARLAAASETESGEWIAVKSWLLRHLPGKRCVPVALEGRA